MKYIAGGTITMVATHMMYLGYNSGLRINDIINTVKTVRLNIIKDRHSANMLLSLMFLSFAAMKYL